MDFLSVEQSVWHRLQEETRPIALYGMGDGADKILAQFDRLGIRASAVFASDEFARGNLFHGFCVRKLSDTVAELGEDIVIVIAFASQRPEVLQLMYALEDKYDVVAPDVPVVEGPLFDEDFVRAHQDEMQRAYDLLADDLSREVFLDTVRFKLSGKMEYLRHSESDKDEVFHNLLRPTAEEHFSDLGAYNGDTIRELLHYTDGKFASVTALEPDRRSFRKLNEWASANITGDVTLVPGGRVERGHGQMLHRSGRPPVPRSGQGQRDADVCARQRAVRPPVHLSQNGRGGRRARSHRRRRENHSAVRTQAEHCCLSPQ